MKINEILTEAPAIPGAPGGPAVNVRYIDPKGVQGRIISLTQKEIDQMVRDQKLDATAASSKRLARGIISTPVIQKVNGRWQVVSGHDDIASLASLPNPRIKAIAVTPQQTQQPAQGNQQPGQQSAAAQKMAGLGNTAQSTKQGPGVISQITRGYQTGSNAASNLGYKISGVANTLGAR